MEGSTHTRILFHCRWLNCGARRELLEIRQADLGFDLAETKAFLGQTSGVSLPDDTIAILDKSIEGWVVGLQ
jgi:serine/threonine-protein kinase PknK